jgi:hypothetical protein
MISLRIHHRTTYRYRSPVGFGPHRLMLRPRETHELRLTAFEPTTMPQASVTWAHDVWGNAVASANFQAMGDTVAIESIAGIELDTVAWPVFDISASAIVYPFRYSDNEWIDLGALTMLQYPNPDGRLRGWARGFVGAATSDTLALLKDLGAGVSDAILYQSRDEGVPSRRSPLSTGGGAQAGTSPCSSPRPRAAWALEPGSSQGISTPLCPARAATARHTPRPRSSCRERAGSHSTPRTAVSVAPI